MATPAMTAHLPFTPAVRRAKPAVGPLVFDEPGGPVVAVCGLAGGAGTSTIALLLARQAAADSAAPVLLGESYAGRGLALLAGRGTRHSLNALAVYAAAGETPDAAFAEIAPGLRLVACIERTAHADDAPVSQLLNQAREAHGLVVVDGGTTWSPDDQILAAATHRVWVFPATPAGLAAARVARPPSAVSGRDVAVAVARDPNALVSVRAIRRTTRGRYQRLALVPYSERLARGELDVDDSIAHAIGGIATALRGGR